MMMGGLAFTRFMMRHARTLLVRLGGHLSLLGGGYAVVIDLPLLLQSIKRPPTATQRL